MLKMAWIAHVFSDIKKGLYPKRVPRESNNFTNASHDALKNERRAHLTMDSI